MLAHPSSENDIRARAAALSDLMLTTRPDDPVLAQARQACFENLRGVTLGADRMTLFAMERVGVKLGTRAVWLDGADVAVPDQALVVISPQFEVPADPGAVIDQLRRAAFVVAPLAWKIMLEGAGLRGLSIDEEQTPAATPSVRKPGRP